jgi:hypothetical protein
MLEHDAHFFTSDEPCRHTRIPSSTCHHQTADAITFLPRPAGYSPADAAAIEAQATAGIAGGRGGLGGSSSSSRRMSRAEDGAVEEVVVSHRTLLNIWQLAPGQVGTCRLFDVFVSVAMTVPSAVAAEPVASGVWSHWRAVFLGTSISCSSCCCTLDNGHVGTQCPGGCPCHFVPATAADHLKYCDSINDTAPSIV